MANEINTSAKKLTERILADAQASAAATLLEAEQACEDARAQAQRESVAAAQAFIKRMDETTNAILERSRTNAELTARKQALDLRREVLERVFNEAYEKLCAMQEDERANVCQSLLLNEAEGGELVLAAQAERDLIGALLPAVNEHLQNAGKQALQLSNDVAANIAHGFVLVGGGFEKDCSFYALLRDARILEETNVSGILFD